MGLAKLNRHDLGHLLTVVADTPWRRKIENQVLPRSARLE
jgi:hypothetical protein